MSTSCLHLVHLAALALLFYLAALGARLVGLGIAVALFLPLGMLLEARFWWVLFRGGKHRAG